MKFSCIKLTEVHNSILQATVECGWLGGPLLFLSLWWREALFIVFLSLAHGRISRDAVLSAFLGCAIGMKETARRPAPVTSAVFA